VGAGPGDPGLLTLKGLKRLEDADVVIHDHLVSAAILSFIPNRAERVYVGKWAGESLKTQEEIGDLLVNYAQRNLRVVRLKGGDVFLFGRGGEECSRLKEACISYEIVPGVSSALAVPAYAGVPVTDRRIASSLVVVTGHDGIDVEKSRVDWERLASAGDTLVILMGTRKVADITKQLMDFGKSPNTPAAMIFWGTTGRQDTRVSTLRDLAGKCADMVPPTVIVIGEVVRLRESISWFEKGPLFGLGILNTRPLSRGKPLGRELASMGARVVDHALLECKVLNSGHEPFLKDLKTSDWLVATSAHVAEALFEWGIIVPEQTRLAVVGDATAETFRSFGYDVDVVSRERSAEGLCHQLLEEHPEICGQRVLFAKGSRGLSTVSEVLQAAGAVVANHVVYETTPADHVSLAKLESLLERENPDFAVITSPLSAETWVLSSSARVIPTVAISKAVQTILEKHDCPVAAVAPRPGDEGLVSALIAAALATGNPK